MLKENFKLNNIAISLQNKDFEEALIHLSNLKVMFKYIEQFI